MKQIETDQNQACEKCGAANARRYEQYFFGRAGEQVDEGHVWLCVKCVRAERRAIRDSRGPAGDGLTREELIAELDRFWNESGAMQICIRCHEQQTGCCPPMCRSLGPAGCRNKNVFCAGFICSALLNAIRECDAALARLLKRVKWNYGSAEFRVYEMMTRVPPEEREQTRPLALPARYPPLNLPDGNAIRQRLLALADEVLEVRRRWNKADREDRR